MSSLLFYIDPGSSGLLVQIIIGAVLAVGVFFRSVRDRIRRFFNRKPSSSNEPQNP